ncbi:MAG: DUF2283 domain-containing protein [Chloroflexi bacterium]|nr:DUF2283 domain-containing protein [Chloroflexota bacterium]
MASINIKEILSLTPQLLNIPFKRIWYSYDEEADVLYLNFKKPSHADDSELTDDDVIIRYEGEEVVGVTILNASKRAVNKATEPL